MTTEHNRDSMTPKHNRDQPAATQGGPPREQCTGCGAMLVEDQRYCLQCGARRGKARIDFTAFWGTLSPTHSSDERPTAGASFLGTGAPSRRMTAVLAAAVLAVGIVAGVALGPGPASSPADSAALAQRALAALVASGGGDAQTSSPTSAAPATAPPPSTSEPTPTPATTSAAAIKAKSAPAPSAASGSAESPGESSTTPSGGSSKTAKGESEKASPGTPIKLPPIEHVWVIALSATSFSAALADPTGDPYLAKQLVPKGTLLSGYTLSASSALGNGIALLSGQAVNLDTEQNCPTYSELQPPTVNATTGLAEGVGCVYPASVKTLADELTTGSLTWKAYVQGMEEGAPVGAQSSASATQGAGASSDASQVTAASSTTRGAGAPSDPSQAADAPSAAQTSAAPAAGATQPAGSPNGTSPAPDAQTQPTSAVTCRRPELGTPDPNHTPAPNDPYLTYRNPFVYFDSLLSEGGCATGDVDLTQLQASLASPADTPALSWIVPSACDDGSATPCAPGAPAGLAPADAFLREVVPQILATGAYGKGGLIVIVPDSPPPSPASAASQPVGALLLSPFVRSGVRVSETFNDFSLSKSISLLFGVLPLGHASDPSTVSFGASVYRTTK